MSEQQTISTNQLLEEIADLSARLNQIRPGIGALVYCPRCWKPPYMHKGGTIKGCKSKDKWPVDQFTNDLLRQRNNSSKGLGDTLVYNKRAGPIKQAGTTLKYGIVVQVGINVQVGIFL